GPQVGHILAHALEGEVGERGRARVFCQLGLGEPAPKPCEDLGMPLDRARGLVLGAIGRGVEVGEALKGERTAFHSFPSGTLRTPARPRRPLARRASQWCCWWGERRLGPLGPLRHCALPLVTLQGCITPWLPVPAGMLQRPYAAIAVVV